MQTRSQTKMKKEEANIFIKLEDEFPEKYCNYLNEKLEKKEIKSETELELESELDFVYDFDYASECWKSNKQYVGNGCYKYKCQCITKKGNPCVRTALPGEINCKIHLK
jgi:hypothetical protein|uniref:Uncharacterized protein n=1 Tax=viral metagenome TaxID=1070528 RepID=A0A6C0IMW6_9ZZZZ